MKTFINSKQPIDNYLWFHAMQRAMNITSLLCMLKFSGCRGIILRCQYELDSEAHIIPSVTTTDLHNLFGYEVWLYLLHGLAEALCPLSELNEKKTPSQSTRKQIFKREREREEKNCFRDQQVSVFQLLNSFITTNKIQVKHKLESNIKGLCHSLCVDLQEYYQEYL